VVTHPLPVGLRVVGWRAGGRTAERVGK
jgi:hypothetical protein